MMVIRQLSVFVENRVGTLGAITGALREQGIDIRAISLSDTVEYGIVRLIVSDPERTEKALREKSFAVSITEVMGVMLEDAPGGLDAVLKILERESISVEYVYAYVSKSQDACVILSVKDHARAAKVLLENGITLLRRAY